MSGDSFSAFCSTFLASIIFLIFFGSALTFLIKSPTMAIVESIRESNPEISITNLSGQHKN